MSFDINKVRHLDKIQCQWNNSSITEHNAAVGKMAKGNKEKKENLKISRSISKSLTSLFKPKKKFILIFMSILLQTFDVGS